MIKYLNHIFNNVSINNKFIYKCSICNIEIWHHRLGFYFKMKNEIQYNRELKLTCEEVQIKKLIE